MFKTLFIILLFFVGSFAQILYSDFNSTTPCVKIKVIIPAYFSLTNYIKQKIISNAENVILIASAGIRPRMDLNLREFIKELRSKGGTVLGYIHTSWGSRNKSYVKEDVDLWIQYYPEIDGFFIDEVSNELNKLSYYEELYKYIKSKGNYTIMLNPGTLLPTEYNNVGDSIMIFENTYEVYNSMGTIPNPSKYKNPAAIVYNVKPEKAYDVIMSLINQGFKYIYVYDAAKNVYDHLSNYFDLMIKLLSSKNNTKTNNAYSTQINNNLMVNQEIESINTTTDISKSDYSSMSPLLNITNTSKASEKNSCMVEEYGLLMIIFVLISIITLYVLRNILKQNSGKI
ncbi:MAG: spherulation-specific family 4 protein [Staphylothermus sp.]|nr:spherulation-specific family 4 protein [Staphylothermus sp.]